MKTSKLISALFVSSLLGLSACTPRDVKVVDDATRLKINAKKGSGGRSTQRAGANGEFALGNYALSAFLAEKQVEAIELVKLSAGSLDASRTQYIVTSQADRADGAKDITLASSKDILEYATGAGGWKAKASKTLQAVLTQKEGAIESLSLKGANLKSSVDSSDKDKTYVNLVENTYELTVAPIEGNAAALAITLKSEGTISGAKGGKNTPNKITLSLQMTVDKDSLATQDVKILKSEAVMTYPGTNGRTFNSGLQAADLLVKSDGLCNSLHGSVTGSAGPKNKYTVNFDGEQISVVGKNWTNTLATCGKRPTVDLSRLQIF